jgi:hypothetical protein
MAETFHDGYRRGFLFVQQELSAIISVLQEAHEAWLQLMQDRYCCEEG